MENTLFIALSRQMTVRRQLETVANNLANANTAGFKSEKLMFVEYLSKSDNGKSQMHFVQDLASARNHNPGKYDKTGNAFDMAIEGPGFFVVENPKGEQRYTRDGQFRLSQEGTLINRNGLTVNVSTETERAADDAIKAGLPAVLTVDSEESRNAWRTSAGNLVMVCPAQMREGTTCSTCELCHKRGARVVIAFIAHGNGKKKANAALAGAAL